MCVQGLSLVLSEGGLKDGDERDQPMEEDSADAELLPGYQWLLQDLPKLPLFDSVRGMTSTALQQVDVSLNFVVCITGNDGILLKWFYVSLNHVSCLSPPEGHPHGDGSPDDQRLSHLPVPACTSGGAGFSQ